MNGKAKLAATPVDDQGRLLFVVLLAPVVGVAAGVVGATLRRALEQAGRWGDALITWAHGGSFAGFLLVTAVCSAAAAVAAWVVRRYAPYASGSGIPHV